MRNRDKELLTKILQEVATDFVPGMVEGIITRLELRGIDLAPTAVTATPTAPLKPVASTSTAKPKPKKKATPKTTVKKK